MTTVKEENDKQRTLELAHIDKHQKAARAMLKALKRMVADLREQEETKMCSRMRLHQINDLAKAIAQAEAAGITTGEDDDR